MASPAPWLRWTQTELTRCRGEEEEEEEDDFERRMDEDGVIGLGEGARSPPWGGSEDPEEGSPAEEGRWHPPQHPAEEDEERGSSGGDEEPWGAESDGECSPELSSEGRWGSGSSGSPEALRDGRALCQRRGCSTDEGDTSGLSDTSPGPATPSRQHRDWGAAAATIGGHGREWSPRPSLPLRLSTGYPSPERAPEPQAAGTGISAPGTAGLAPTGQPQGAGNPSAPAGHSRSRVPKKAAPAVLPPKPTRQSRSLSPRRRTGGKGARDPSGTGTDGTQYGRGRLNHPLPDLSKVEARVKFDQSYRPPRGRVLPARPRGPIGFKSPAEIVREVLLSSGEGASPQPPSTAGLPQEFRSPRQATALVQQLQDDYHKLLTKYAEAENTIDQLRLGARVSLFSDPPQPSRSLAVGTVATGSRVLTLSIPQAQTAALGMATAPATAPASPGAAAAPGPSERGGSPQPRSPPLPGGRCPTCPGPCCCPGPRLTRALAGQSRRLQAQVESFESWMRAGTPTPSEQLQRMRMLKDAQDALEREYLRGRQQLPEAAGGFDPDRALEGEIYRLGLRLEGLKERLEPGGRRQPPSQPLPQHPPQPRCPPAPPPAPAAHSPRPESPALVEGPRGTAGDSEGVAGGLPQPLWHKRRQVEEDFGDLLEQYKHFKSLPESLSLEQLSLAENGSQEEVDAPAAGDSGLSKVPCRTRSLEEGPTLKTLPLHLPERRAATLSPRGPPNLGDTRGHPSPTAAEEPPAPVKPPLGVSGPLRVPPSLCSSETGSAAIQHGPRKEQRIVSPETDSGFVGSEASRVSPPVHTPEHQPPGPGTPGSLGPSLPIPGTLRTPRKRETPPLPSETALLGLYLPGGTGGPRLPPSSPSQSSSHPRWGESAGSEVGPDPDGDGTHTDSEVGDRSCASAGGHPPAMARSPTSPLPSPETPSPTLLSPDLPSLEPAPCDLLGSRLERDQAIRALQDEVWRLRLRLEESLHGSRSYPEGKATPRVTPARRQPGASGPSPPQDAATSGDPMRSPPVRSRAPPALTPTRRERPASLPRGRPELDLGLELGPSGSHATSLSSAAASESEASPAGPRAPPALRKHLGKPPGAVTFRGRYTGTRYQGGTPRATPAPQEEPGTSGCSRCLRGRMASAGLGGADAPRLPQHSTPRTMPCPTCRAPMGPSAPGNRDRATHAERGPGGSCPPGPHAGAEKPEQPGIWYLAGTPAATAATVCLAPVPLVPYVPSMLYCSPAVPTSAPALPGVPLGVTAGPPRAERPPRGRHGCLSLDLEELEELNWSLGRAVEAAQSVRLTTTRLSRALAAELGRARGLRGSCLF